MGTVKDKGNPKSQDGSGLRERAHGDKRVGDVDGDGVPGGPRTMGPAYIRTFSGRLGWDGTLKYLPNCIRLMHSQKRL